MSSKREHNEIGAEREITIPEPTGWIQFKGTDICMDVRCVCGHLGHVDDDFTYFIICTKCKRTYRVNATVQLVELTEAEVAELGHRAIVRIAE